MSLHSEEQHSSKREQGLEPEYAQETLQYLDDQLVLAITGKRGSKLALDITKGTVGA